MSATYLIDGYNLLHGMGVLSRRTGPGGLEQARQRLLGILKGAFGEDSSAVTVVFDAAGAPPGAAGAQTVHGIAVRYALGKETQADDLIEEMLCHAADPKHLTIVSDDHRLQQAAKRRHARFMDTSDFLDFLAKKRAQTHAPRQPPEKRSHISAEETQQWLAEFGDIVQDQPFDKTFDRSDPQR